MDDPTNSRLALERRRAELLRDLADVERRLSSSAADIPAAAATPSPSPESVLNHDLKQVLASDTAALLIDREGRISHANAAVQQLFGSAISVGRSLAEALALAFSPDSALGQNAISGPAAWDQREVQAVDGRWFVRRSLPVLDAEAAPAGAVITFTLSRATGTLEERLKLAMASMKLVWWDWDFGLGTIAIYGDTRCLLDYAVDTLPRTAAAWFELTHPDDLKTVQNAIEDCLSDRTSEWALEHRFRAADGTWRWVLTSGKLAERDALGRPTRMLGITLDIHARRSAEDLLRRDARILAELEDVVIYCDADYRIAYVNDAFEKVFGRSRESALGQDITFRLPPHTHAEILGYKKRVLEGVPLRIEWEDYRADGSRVWIQWRCQRTVDANGHVTGFINIGTDIDARKRAEQQREALQQQLIQAQRMETLGSLAGGIAHDFNNILAAIFGFTEIALATTNPSDQSKHYHKQVLKASERARELVKRILSFSRFHEPERRPVRLRELLEEANKFIRAALPSSVEIAFHVECDCPPTLADPHQLHQVLLNLATNAAHAIGSRAGLLAITLRCTDVAADMTTAIGRVAAGRYAVIEVTDDGHGMDAATQAKIFDPFFTTKKEGEGTGLGLSVVSAILRGHNGGILVRSTLGEGTTFSVYLPIVADVQVIKTAPDEAFAARTRARGETIAIIDDEEMVATAAEKILQALGYRTHTFPSAERFSEVFATAATGIDLLLTDQTMPRTTGIELALKLREQGYTLPILLMSGFSTQLRPELINAVGRAAVIRKPFDRFELARAIRALLDERSAP
jgi:PAS domain S-box-containing protein